MKTKEDIVNELKACYPGMFKTFDWAIPQQWADEIRNFSTSTNLAYIWVYYDQDGCQVKDGYPYPLDHFSAIVLEKWSLCEEQMIADIHVHINEYGHFWMDREPKLLHYEDLLLQMVTSQQITDLEAMVMLELIDKFGSGMKDHVQVKLPYLTEAFSSLFEEGV